jgi:large subunit ribosomal protein L10
LNLEEKKKIAENLHARFSKSSIMILADYKGLNVTVINDLRRKLREQNVEFQVVKNTMLTRASADTDAALIKDYFKGPSAVVFGYDDPVAPARVLIKFAEEHDELKIKAGVMKGKMLDIGAVKTLSALPSREVVLSQFLAACNAVPASLVRTLSAIPKKLLYVLLAIKEQKEAA